MEKVSTFPGTAFSWDKIFQQQEKQEIKSQKIAINAFFSNLKFKIKLVKNCGK